MFNAPRFSVLNFSTSRMNENLSQLYHGIILDHNRAPQFYEKRPGAQHVVEAYNPLCGDKFKLYLDIENEVITGAAFHGYGCAVSKASASVLMQKIQGLTLDALPAVLDTFLNAVATGKDDNAASDAEAAAFAVAKNFPGREKCAVLAWEALRNWKLEIEK